MVQSQQTILKSGKKLNFICFKPTQKRIQIEFTISIDKKEIFHVKETSFWGVIIDEHLTLNPHITNIYQLLKLQKQ